MEGNFKDLMIVDMPKDNPMDEEEEVHLEEAQIDDPTIEIEDDPLVEKETEEAPIVGSDLAMDATIIKDPTDPIEDPITKVKPIGHLLFPQASKVIIVFKIKDPFDPEAGQSRQFRSNLQSSKSIVQPQRN